MSIGLKLPGPGCVECHEYALSKMMLCEAARIQSHEHTSVYVQWFKCCNLERSLAELYHQVLRIHSIVYFFLICEPYVQVVAYAILDVLAKVVFGFLVVFADQAEEQYERLADGANESA